MNILKVLVGIVLGVVATFAYSNYNISKSVGSLPVANYYSLGTNTTAIVGSTGGLILATSTARNYAAIVNSSSTDVYLSFGTPAVVGSGYFLKGSGGVYVIDSANLYVGAIYAKTFSGSTTLTIVYDR